MTRGDLNARRSEASLARGRDLPRLYAIVDVDVCARLGWAPRDLAVAYFSGGATLLQLRAKHLAGAPFLELADAVCRDARAAGARVIINDRADLAALAGADGVHLGQDDLTPDEVRRIASDSALIGRSTHTRRQVERALGEPIDYLAIGPVSGTATKDTGYAAVGEHMVREVADLCTPAGLPVVAIGGITLETARQVIDAGAASVAVISDLVKGDPAARVRAFLTALSS